MLGRTIGHYRILDKLGEGGMGEVYLAEDRRLERRVALKLLPDEMSADPARLSRFEREAKLLAALDHPAIVTIYSVEEGVPEGADEPLRFLTMELVRGSTLAQQIGRGGLDADRLVDIAIQLADALAAAHARGITHRDLKPANVMTTDDGRVKVLDFGVARRQSTEDAQDAELATFTMTVEGTLLGTLPYMSPEQIEGRAAEPRSDLFSLGVVLYEMATGRRPFQGGSAARLLSSILRDEPPPLRQVRTALPAALERIVHRCLEKSPQARFQTASELRGELEALRRELMQEPAPSRPVRSTHSLAVLPLANLSGDPAQEFFADGLTEALITDLARVRALKVISRTSVMRYKGAMKPLPEIGRELGVDAIVEGSVLRAGDRVRINAQLIEAASDEHLWAESYEREASDILGLQSEISQAIAKEIMVQLTPEEQRRLAATRRLHPKAHEAYLRGRFFWNKRTAADFRTALRCFEEAIERDPTWALAWVGLADTYTLLERYGVVPPREVMPRAKAAAEKALQLEPDLAEAHAAHGIATLYFDFDRPRARRALRRAIELKPAYATAHHWLAWLESSAGNDDLAESEIQAAHELDPLSLIVSTNRGTIAYFGRRFDLAAQRLEAVLQLEPDFAVAHQWLGRTYEQTGRVDRAIAAHRAALRLLGDDPESIGSLGRAQALAGDETAARQALERLRELAAERFVSRFWPAVVCTGLRELDQVVAHLEAAFEERFDWVNSLRVDAMFDDLRDHPGFRELAARIGPAEGPPEP